jgi:sulfoxide reductase heme-binding subunit YedZ
MAFPIKVAKPVIFLLCLFPFAALAWAIVFNGESLGADPLSAITDRTGDWTLRFVLITLAITPLRQISGWNTAVRFRRMLGLFAFFYGFLHFISYVWFTVVFDIHLIIEDVIKRKFITVGFTAFVLMIPLAITSTKKWISRLGGKRWQTLHKAVYITGVLGVIHYIWRVKSDIEKPLIYAAILALLLGIRLWNKFKPAPVVR